MVKGGAMIRNDRKYSRKKFEMLKSYLTLVSSEKWYVHITIKLNSLKINLLEVKT